MAYIERVRFEWRHKERANQKEHGLSFDEAVELFTGDSDYLEIYDKGRTKRIVSLPLVRSAAVSSWWSTASLERMSFGC
jgi:uncharacterized DUF497 family protein